MKHGTVFQCCAPLVTAEYQITGVIIMDDKEYIKPMGLYAIYDKVAEESGPIFTAVNEGVATRQAVQILRPLPPHTRDDYCLMHVGHYDLKTCVITLQSPPQVVDVNDAMMRSIADELSKRNIQEVEA